MTFLHECGDKLGSGPDRHLSFPIEANAPPTS